MASRRTATVRSCLAVGAIVLTAVTLGGITGEPRVHLAAGPDGVAGGVENRSNEARSLRIAQSTGKPVRIDSLTSETTEVWALPDGQFRADISTGVQRFRRAGEWVPVDLTLRSTPDGSVAPVAHPNDLRVSGAKGPGGHELASVGTDDRRIAMGWRGPLPAPVLDEHRAVYVDALPGVDLVVEATRLGFEQFLVVKERAAVAQVRQVTLPLTGPGAARASREPDGAITLTGRTGQVTFRIPAPLMWDAKKNQLGEPLARRSVRTDLTHGEGRTELALLPDAAWLNSRSTAFPVTIDPTVDPVGTTFDTYVEEGVSADLNGAKDLRIGLLPESPAKLTRSFITWDTTLFAGKHITAATVSLWNWWSHTCAPTAWEIWSTDPATYTTTFANQPTWGTAPEASSTATHGSTDCADGWATINGVAFFQRASDENKTRAGMGLRAADEASPTGFTQFASREGTDPSHDPRASVTYNSWPTVTARETVPATTCATGAGRPVVNTLTPQLKATVNDADGTAMSVVFEWWALDGGSAIGARTFTGVASGATASATVTAGSFAEGGSYKWRVKAADGVAGSDRWSSFCEMTVWATVPPVLGCTSGADSDFNGDGVSDIAIADPQATASGQAKAGLIHVTYGGTGTVQTLHEGVEQVPGTAEPDDGFGTSVSAYDANNDGCGDLLVGVPYQDVNGQADAGLAYVLLGTPSGLAKGPASHVYHQGVSSVPDVAEPGDWFGFSVAGNRTVTGQPYLVVGVPGEDVGTVTDAGLAHYLRGPVSVALAQGAGIPGTAETDDRAGYAVAASTYHWAASSPGESIGGAGFAGAVSVFSHTLASGQPTAVGALHQDAVNVSNAAEADDTFGKAVSIAPYRPAGTPAGQAESLVVVGVPGEDLTASSGSPRIDAGLVHRFHVKPDNTVTELPSIYGSQDGTYLGERVLVINTAPASEANLSTMFIAVGVPGDDVWSVPDSGQIRVIPALADPIGTPLSIHRRSSSIPGQPRQHELIGTSLAGTSQRLYVGTPYGTPAVYGFTWADLAGGSVVPVLTWAPGSGGIPAGETAFGAAIG
ncbi:Repeat domain-containing protein [Micromonospora inyonensis]|uniref:Repeat domain-containing protein n=1 Tax=Micromonospora inyonensis TaxID=47866 RepID=A0A1C6S4Q1_9ACTN|nr:Repeat domain-containing protein [Micromonospora inyonensis]